MEKYRKLPVVIEAMQFDYSFTSVMKIKEWTGSLIAPIFVNIGECYIQMLGGEMRVNDGDWIIKGINGEFYPCKPEIFEKTYELVKNADGRE